MAITEVTTTIESWCNRLSAAYYTSFSVNENTNSH